VTIAGVFKPHKMPVGALPVRCHVLNETKAQVLEDFLVRQLPDCYIAKTNLQKRVKTTGLSAAQIFANKLPDPGNVMSGDFGEIVTMFFLSDERPEEAKPIRKWRYKQDRRKTAPHSDVIILYRKSPDNPERDDYVICAEAKQKATASKTYFPIQKAVESLSEDSTGRLARALSWLREKAIDHERTPDIAFLDRFTIDLRVEYAKYFKAVAIVDRKLLDDELTRKLDLPTQDASFEVVVLGIGDLQRLYESVFSRAVKEVTVE